LAARGPASDVEIRVRYMLKLKQRINSIIAKHCAARSNRLRKTPTATTSCHPKKQDLRPGGRSRAVRKEIPGLAEHATSLADKKE